MVRNLPQCLVRRSWILNAVLLLTCAVESTGAQTYVGVASGAFQNSYSEQARDEWCWAASLQMIYSYYGLNVPQSEIVRRSYGVQDANGTLPNWGGSFQLEGFDPPPLHARRCAAALARHGPSRATSTPTARDLLRARAANANQGRFAVAGVREMT
jgi:hypothetical protein